MVEGPRRGDPLGRASTFYRAGRQARRGGSAGERRRIVTGLPRGSECHPPSGSGGQPQSAREALAAPVSTESPQTPDEHRVVPERIRLVDGAHEQLVVSGDRDPEPLPDPSLLRSRLLPPRPFEIEDRAGPFVELEVRFGRLRAHGSSVASRADGASSPGYPARARTWRTATVRADRSPASSSASPRMNRPNLAVTSPLACRYESTASSGGRSGACASARSAT